MIDYSKLEKSLKHLEKQYQNYLNAKFRDELTDLDREGIAESTIQRFETCYDSVWKILKRYLIEILGLPETPNSPKPIFRLAAENRLFHSPIQQWLNYANARIDTAHDYDGDKAMACLALMHDFIEDVIQLYQTMTGQTWN
jgi:nucleotidyltransferase substrate binding protein (TIGR01987 family)